MVTLVIIFWRAKIEGVYALGHPWAVCVLPIFVHHRFAPKQGKRVSVAIVWTVQNVVCGHCGINLWRAQHVEGVLDLGVSLSHNFSKNLLSVVAKAAMNAALNVRIAHLGEFT